jgi:hypothetical protein
MLWQIHSASFPVIIYYHLITGRILSELLTVLLSRPLLILLLSLLLLLLFLLLLLLFLLLPLLPLTLLLQLLLLLPPSHLKSCYSIRNKNQLRLFRNTNAASSEKHKKPTYMYAFITQGAEIGNVKVSGTCHNLCALKRKHLHGSPVFVSSNFFRSALRVLQLSAISSRRLAFMTQILKLVEGIHYIWIYFSKHVCR